MAATLHGFALATRALAVGAVIPQGDDFEPTVLRYDIGDGILTVAEGDQIRAVPDAAGLGGRNILGLDLPRLPPFTVDVDEGSITGGVGALELLAGAVMRLAAALGRDAMASIEIDCLGAADPLEIASDGNGEVAVTCGDVAFEVPSDWPPSGPAAKPR